MKYVIDASVAVKSYLPETYEQEASRLLKGRHQLHVPELILPELGNIVWKRVRRAEITKDEAETIIAAISRKKWTIHPHRNTFRSAFTGAEATGQTVYDWTYLALAISLSCEFVTADEKFYKALASTVFNSNVKWIGSF